MLPVALSMLAPLGLSFLIRVKDVANLLLGSDLKITNLALQGLMKSGKSTKLSAGRSMYTNVV